jgi:hypothetical protein
MGSKAQTRPKTKKTASRPRAKAHDQRLLERASAEAAEGESSEALKAYVNGQLVKACDQLGGAIAAAQQADDIEGVENLTPVLATLWSTRLELGETLGGAS